MNTLDQDDLIEQHPELRLQFFDPSQAVQAQGSRLIDQPGAYEWWQFEAFDADGSGICVSLYNGDPFHPRYRRAVRRKWSQHPVEPADLRATTFPAARVSIFEKKVLIARGHWSPAPRSFVVAGAGTAWSAQVGPVTLSTSPDGKGWHLQIKETTTQRLGFKGFIQPARAGGRKILQVDLQLVPAFATTTLQRAAMPDSPDGSTHDWLLVCPAGSVTGEIAVENATDRTAALRSTETTHLTLGPAAFGSLQQFWGTGLLGNGIRRWYRGSLITDHGAIFVELPVIQKYIQLAGTLMHFAPDGKQPTLLRCDHQRAAGFQRSAWLLAHPLSMDWCNEAEHVEIGFPIETLHDAQPFRGVSLCETQFESGEIPDELIVGPGLGIFEILQPARADWRLWEKYLTHP